MQLAAQTQELQGAAFERHAVPLVTGLHAADAVALSKVCWQPRIMWPFWLRPKLCCNAHGLQVAALLKRVRQEQHGQLDVLVNTAWGGNEWDVTQTPPFWELPLQVSLILSFPHD